MRQVHVQVPRGAGVELTRHARELGASTMSRHEATGGDGQEVDVVVCTVPNASVGELIDRAYDLGTTEASIPAAGAFAFEPPAGEPPDALVDVTARSSYEVVLAGQQAAGSWTGFLAFSVIAGVVVWLGLFTETIYLLTAAMLIAPFAGPAMNTAIAIVSGRGWLLRHSLARYAAGIGIAAVVSAAMTLATGQETVPGMLISVVTVTPVAVLLPLAAGVAGALYLTQSEHSSLISGAAVGLLVAASLAPTAGGIGMALALGRPELALYAAFLVALQLTGITTTAVTALWIAGISPSSARFAGDSGRLLRVGLGVVATLTVALVTLQVATAPALVQGARERDAAAVVTTMVTRDDRVGLLRVDPDVATAPMEGPPRILVDVVLERRPGTPEDSSAEEWKTLLEQRLREQLPDVITHVDVTVFDAPPARPASD